MNGAHLQNLRDSSRQSIYESLAAGVGYWLVTSCVVWFAASFASNLVTVCPLERGFQDPFPDRLAVWDGEWYETIVEKGYSYDRNRQSNLAFFPAYPLLSRAIQRLTGLTAIHAMILVANLLFCGCMILAHLYVKRRWLDAPTHTSDYVVLATGLLPFTLYFRMAYSESLFLFVVLLSLYGMRQNWSIWAIALIIGFGTAVRSVGVGLIAPLICHILMENRPWWQRILRLHLVMPVASFGLLAYMVYQWSTWGDPLIFVNSQSHWSTIELPAGLFQKLGRLLIFVPLTSIYQEGCPCNWSTVPPAGTAAFSLQFAQPIFWITTIIAIAWGAWKKWLDPRELSLAIALIAIPYVIQADKMCMLSQARFLSVVFPMYMVCGRIISQVPAPAQTLAAAFCAFLLMAYTALFTSWYWMF